MSVGLPSDEVAEDYKSSLEELNDNSRLVINNLTVIAKENIEHASAICRVLENHIKNTSPHRKLPALYLLDSIVKNVGTPYTLFLSRSLYSTFMNAYSLVNTLIRQKLDEMLQTWKAPNPGSLETKPVFPVEVTRPIEEALQKARAAFFERQQQANLRNQHDTYTNNRHMQHLNLGYRHTTTPPQASSQYQAPSQHHPSLPTPQPPMAYSQPTTNTPVSGHFSPVPAIPLQGITGSQVTKQYQPPLPPVDLPQLHRDIEELVRSTQAESLLRPHDPATSGRLTALISLQQVLHQQYHPPDQLRQVRDKVLELKGAQTLSIRSGQQVTESFPPSTFSHAQSFQLPQSSVHSTAPPIPTPAPSPAEIEAMMSSRNLATIIAKAQQASTPAPNASSQLNLAFAANNNESSSNSASDLLASLTRAGVLRGQPDPASHLNLKGTTPIGRETVGPTEIRRTNDVQLSSASLKIPRPTLIPLLYEAQSNQCTTCGRRFTSTTQGRDEKSRHYDWHFRTNSKLNDAAKRAQNRSWYVDELEWIKFRDDLEGNPVDTSAVPADGTSTDDKHISKQHYVKVPSDQNLVAQPCPICQEKFTSSYSDELSDWVWMDAVQIGNRIFHASCYEEIKRNQSREPTPASIPPRKTDTPDSVLGKRKALDAKSELDPKMIKV